MIEGQTTLKEVFMNNLQRVASTKSESLTDFISKSWQYGCFLHVTVFTLYDSRKTLAKNSEKYHYANTPMQYTAIFHGCKTVNFQTKNYNIFLFFL